MLTSDPSVRHIDRVPKDVSTETVLVTGAAGFVGSRVVELLNHTTSHRVLAIDAVTSERTQELAQLPRVDFHMVDLRDLEALDWLVGQADVIVHLAAVRTKASAASTRDAHEVNLGSTYDLATLAADHSVRRIVFGSTNTVYGSYQDPQAAPMREDQPWVCSGINMYAATKLAAEAYLEALAGAGGPDYIALRIGPVYGPRVSPGSNGSLLLDVVDALDAGERPTVSWSRESIHSFVYIDDVAEAIIASLDSPRGRLAINVVGKPLTTRDFATRLVELYGHDPARLSWGEQRTRYQYVSQERMLDVLGFTPRTTLDEGLQAFIDWHRQAPTRS